LSDSASGLKGDTSGLNRLREEIVRCRECPRLVRWREKVASEKKAAYSNEIYWGRPVPGWGDSQAKIVVVGLAPGAHGANRTGRMFTGDESGKWLYRALWKAGWTSQKESTSTQDGLELRSVWITSAVKCAPPDNRPSPKERDRCGNFFEREIRELKEAKVYLALGGFGFEAVTKFFGLKPRPKFGHGLEVQLSEGRWLVGCYHVSQQNTFTGRLTEKMLDKVMARVGVRAGLSPLTR
jgi:uracil-DNA glycosylase